MYNCVLVYVLGIMYCRDPNCPHRHSSCLNEWPHYTQHKHYLELNARHLNSFDSREARGRGHHDKECAFWSTHIPELLKTSGSLLSL